MAKLPKVSVIIPCRNEEKYIGMVLQAIYDQSFLISDMEVLIADGMSEDNTREKIEEFSISHPELEIRILDNRAQIIPAAINLCLREANGEYIIRMDAHSIPNREYVEISIQDLEAEKGTNVGGVWDIKSHQKDWFSRGIAAAMENPFGVGDAKYRYTGTASHVETVPFGAFKKSLIDEIGNFDESLLANEDYEFNHRIRKAGGEIWLNPEIRSKYFARPTLNAVWKQYWRYGYWKLKMLMRFPESLRARQAIPPLFVSTLVLLFIGAFLWTPVRWILFLEVVLYWMILLLAGIKSAIKDNEIMHLISVPITIITVHISWGSAFLWSILRTGFRKV
jgi:succinoglycan biosynthesis protein ExoA